MFYPESWETQVIVPGGSADTSAVVESNMYDKWRSTWVKSSQRRPLIAIFYVSKQC